VTQLRGSGLASHGQHRRIQQALAQELFTWTFEPGPARKPVRYMLTVGKNQMTTTPQHLLLLIACLIAPLNDGRTSPEGQAPVSLQSSSRMEVAHCSSYISAYGVSIAQYERIESNWKRFQSVCPAPSPANVDFVVIFTHDVNFYNYTMPTPIHTDSSGFSNWSAVVILDNTQASAKYKHEYVWVFRIKRGSFDPAHFSPNAKPDYSAVESGTHANDRAVDASFRFIAGQKE
jgi:hypothetical protein